MLLSSSFRVEYTSKTYIQYINASITSPFLPVRFICITKIINFDSFILLTLILLSQYSCVVGHFEIYKCQSFSFLRSLHQNQSAYSPLNIKPNYKVFIFILVFRQHICMWQSIDVQYVTYLKYATQKKKTLNCMLTHCLSIFQHFHPRLPLFSLFISLVQIDMKLAIFPHSVSCLCHFNHFACLFVFFLNT